MSRSRIEHWHLVVLVAFLVLVFLVSAFTLNERNREYEETHLEFLSQVEITTQSLESQFHEYIGVLYATRGLFAASDQVNRDEWHTFVESQEFYTRYPGIQALGFIQRVEDEDKQEFIASVRSDSSYNGVGYPDFDIRPPGDRPVYFVGNYIYPNQENSNAFGFDLYSNSERAEAISTAVALNQETATEAIELLGGNLGFFIVLPVHNHTDGFSETERRNKTHGVLNIVFDSTVLFDEVLTDVENMHVRILDVGSETVLFNTISDQGSVDAVEYITVAGRQWRLEYSSEDYPQNTLWIIVGSVGLLFAVLLTLLFYLALHSINKRKADEIEKLKSLNEQRLKFISMTSHEIRTPMTPMKGQLELLLNKQHGPLTRKQKQALQIILRNTDRLDRIILDLLDMSRLDSNSMRLDYQEISVKQEVDQVIEEMQSYKPEKNIRLKHSVAKGLRMNVPADRLAQILRNLITNAIKFTPEKGNVRVSAKRRAETVIFTVEDTGVGMTPENAKKVFEPFYQVEQNYGYKSEGTGLGLPIVKGIVEALHGIISVQSTVGKGTTFTVKLPQNPSFTKQNPGSKK